MSKFFVIFLIGISCFQSAFGAFEGANKRCRDQFLFFENALAIKRQWALELYDTWGKFQHNVLVGNVYNFGDYDRCEKFVHVTATSAIETIRGKYCTVSYFLANSSTGENLSFNFDWRQLGLLAKSKNLTLETGICFPEACATNKDVEHVAEYFVEKLGLKVSSVYCDSDQRMSFRMRIIAVVIFSALLLTVVVCTIYELYTSHYQMTQCMTLVAFSVYSNGENLFDMTRRDSSKSIECLNGLRSISLLWIIFGHRYFDMFLSPATNTEIVTDDWLKNILSLTHTTFHLAVDTFFVMGGLLVTWTFMKSFDAKQFNVFKIYFHRYLRYTPVVLFLLFFFVSFMPYLGSGPIFERTLDGWLTSCYNNWWSTLLHIATYTNIDDLCLNWLWFLSADFQLFIFSPLLVYPAWRWRWKFFGAFPGVIILSIAYIFMISKEFNLMVFVGPLQKIGQYDYDRLLYYPTHARCGPWFVGMSLGFVMFQWRSKSPKINKHVSRSLWMISISLLLFVVLGYFAFQQKETNLDIPNSVNATYNSFYRTCWAFGVAWIIFACHNGGGGLIRWFLCLPHFQPLAKMSLSIYLTHRVYQILSIATLRQPIHLRPLELLHVFFGDVIVSIIVGVIVYLCIEAPFATLESRLFRRKTIMK